MREIKILLAGIGGYGENYVSALLEPQRPERVAGVRVAGVVDPLPERCGLLELITENGIPIYPDLAGFYRNCEADLAVLCTPIQFHVDQALYCLAQGSHILCEKPLCALYQDALRLFRAEAASGKTVGIGFQLSFSNAVQALKEDIRAGAFGRPKRLKALLMMARGEQYYRRNGWAGRIRTGDGSWVLDSPVSNACAHQLHNMLYVLGKTRETSAAPLSITAELYRAYPRIENYDTAALRCITSEGVEILLYASLALPGGKLGPLCYYEFENGVVVHEHGNDENFEARFGDGRRKNYGELPKSDRMQKLWDAIEWARGGPKPACGIAAAMPHLLCCNGAQESMPEIVNFPEPMVWITGKAGEAAIAVDGLADTLLDCYNQAKLPHELGTPWSKPGRTITLSDYRGYPTGGPVPQNGV